MLEKNFVGIYLQKGADYPKRPPFFPPHIYPEYPFDFKETDPENKVYESIRNLFFVLGMDRENFNTAYWNPFRGLIKSGDSVVIKPNFVRDFNENPKGEIFSMISHGSVIRVVLDYVFIALKGKGKITIADGPLNDTDFEKILKLTGLLQIRDFYKNEAGFNIDIVDIRREWVVKRNGIIVKRIRLTGDALGYTTVDIGRFSLFSDMGLRYKWLRGAEYDLDDIYNHHSNNRNEYLIPNTILNSDIIIGLPKLKVHKKAGITVSLKNMVGITGDRNWLPHFCEGTPCEGGDQFPNSTFKERLEWRILRVIKNILAKFGDKFGYCIVPLKEFAKLFWDVANNQTLRSGNWHGNDTIWRTILDINKIVLYADKNGELKKEPQRKLFSIVDGIKGGQGNGPLAPDTKESGLLIMGRDWASVDLVSARLMGFDFNKIPKLKNVFSQNGLAITNLRPEDIVCLSNIDEWNKGILGFVGRCADFKPHAGWEGFIEV